MATVLVIEDDPQMLGIVSRLLTRERHAVIEAADGEAGVREFLRHRPAAVVTDILMPRKEGIETIREIRRAAPKVPIIAISGGGRTRNMMFLDLARALGADAVLTKPFRGEELVAMIGRLLARVR